MKIQEKAWNLHSYTDCRMNLASVSLVACWAVTVGKSAIVKPSHQEKNDCWTPTAPLHHHGWDAPASNTQDAVAFAQLVFTLHCWCMQSDLSPRPQTSPWVGTLYARKGPWPMSQKKLTCTLFFQCDTELLDFICTNFNLLMFYC